MSDLPHTWPWRESGRDARDGTREDGSDHRVVSLDGWTCDVCGREVNGQTDEDGTPAQRGDNVHHT